MMEVDELLELLGSALEPLGGEPAEGDESSRPPLEVLTYRARRVRFNRIPFLGRGLSVVTVARWPSDLDAGSGDIELLRRLAMAANELYPPIRGLAIGLTAVVLTPDPIGPDDDERLAKALASAPRSRVVPIGLFLLNLDQEAMAMALAGTPEGLYPEPAAIADVLTPKLRRFVPLGGF